MAELVGILNLTPNSFSEDGDFFKPYYQPEKALAYGERIFEEGASLLDVGAESTAPGAIPVDIETEWWRLKPVLPELIKRHPGQIALDTRHPEIAERALKISEGADRVIINDVTGMNNAKMVNVVAKYGAQCIVSHMHGTDIQAIHDPKADKIDNINVVVYDLMAKHALLVDRGLKPQDIILDPGIGFGKTPELNARLLEIAENLVGYQVMVGASRKRFLEHHFVQEGEDRWEDLAPSLRAGGVALAAGAEYLRVHDVAGHQQLLV